MKAYQTTNKEYFKEIELLKCADENYDVEIDSNISFQEILGFGGAFTDSASHIFNLLNEDLKKKVLKLYFSKSGLNYNLGRMSLGSCDFSCEMYDLYDKDGNLSLEHDAKEVIPFIKAASKYNDLNIMLSPWSAPSKWKTNGEKKHGGDLKEDHYEDYSLYFTNYVKLLKDAGVPITMISCQNEPEASQPWESMRFTPKQEAKLALNLRHDLDNLKLNDVELYIWDHNRDAIVRRASETIYNEELNNAVSGIAYHWYDMDKHLELTKAHELFKDKKLLFTEGCVELLNIDRDNPQSAIGNFDHALRYAINYLNDLNNFSQGFIDWNLLLDELGGPNHVGNYCEALIMYDRNHKNLVINPTYYGVKHFAHFINKGARRVLTKSSNSLVTALKNPNGKTVIIFVNNTNYGYVTNVKIDNKSFSFYNSEKSITTVEV